MKRKTLFAVFAVVAFLWGCGHVPQTHYYLFDYTVSQVGSKVQQNAILGVSKFDVNAPYDQDRLVFRRSPNEVEFYHYHRWVNPPADLVRQKLMADLTASRLFRKIVAYPDRQEIDYLLRGRIIHLEELDEPTLWLAYLDLQIEVVDMKEGKVILETIFNEQEPVVEKTPAGVIQALNSCLKQCSEELLVQLSEKLLSR